MLDFNRLYTEIGKRVRAIRETQTPRISQDALARILDLKRTSITNIESGRQKMTVETVYRLCDHFGLAIDEVMPPVADFRIAAERSVVIGGRTTSVGAKTANLVERLRPAVHSSVKTRPHKRS